MMVTKKYVLIKFPNEVQFKILATTIAKPRAEYYANHDEGEQEHAKPTPAWLKVYNDELHNVDNEDLTDWLFNNMDWKDVKGEAVPVLQEKYDYDKHFLDITSDDYEVIEE